MIVCTDAVTGQRYATTGWLPNTGDLCLMPDGSYRRVGNWSGTWEVGKEADVSVELEPLQPDHDIAALVERAKRDLDRAWPAELAGPQKA